MRFDQQRPNYETVDGAKIARSILTLITIILLSRVQGSAQSEARPPCGMDPDPSYSALDHAPMIRAWNASESHRDWAPPGCTGWTEGGYSTMVAVAGRFRYTAGVEGLLRRIGAISELAGIRYWSTTKRQWRTLIVHAQALTDSQPGHSRGNFSSDDIRGGALVYYEQVDNLSGAAVYGMHIVEASQDRIVFTVENVSTVSRFHVALFRPGEAQSVYFLDRETPNVWRCYSLLRIGRKASWLATGHPASSINRAVAFHRWLTGIPTDQDPPAAP